MNKMDIAALQAQVIDAAVRIFPDATDDHMHKRKVFELGAVIGCTIMKLLEARKVPSEFNQHLAPKILDTIIEYAAQAVNGDNLDHKKIDELIGSVGPRTTSGKPII
jgi:hypothetical protein